MVTYKGTLFEDEKIMKEKTKLENLLKRINEKIMDSQKDDQIALDYWNEKRYALERKLLDLEFYALDIETDA